LKAQNTHIQFEQVALPHLDAAFNLAFWLTGDSQDAEDIVQEAYLRAFKFFDSYHGGNSHAWLLAIVRNTTYTWLRQNRMNMGAELLEDELPDSNLTSLESSFLQKADTQRLREAIAALPVEYREVIVLHDLEGLAYKEIASVANIPMGTVMSRLSRARDRLQKTLIDRQEKEV
jgi:RNA polymerase sigma factor (sigma-70 family)